MAVTQRILYSNTKPYSVPERLEDLRGPRHGSMTLPPNVYWGPDALVDLDTEDGLEKAYQAVIQEGRVEDVVAVIDRARLVEVWGDLLLPPRARDEWEARFPLLRG